MIDTQRTTTCRVSHDISCNKTTVHDISCDVQRVKQHGVIDMERIDKLKDDARRLIEEAIGAVRDVCRECMYDRGWNTCDDCEFKWFNVNTRQKKT